MTQVNQANRRLLIGVLVALPLISVRPASGQTPGPRQAAAFYDITEATSGARLLVSRTPQGDARFEVRHRDLRVTRLVTPRTSTMTILSGWEQLTIGFSGTAVVLEGVGPRLEVALGDHAAAEALRQRMASSALVASAISLLADVRVESTTAIGGLLASTRFLLRSLRGDAEAAQDAITVRRAVVGTARLVRARVADETCWETYVREALSAWEAFMECRNAGLAWVPGYLQFCDFNYDVRAVSALAAYFACAVTT